VTDTCNINWHIASSGKESFTVFIALPLFPIIECDVNNANNIASFFTYKSKQFTKSEAALFAIKRHTFISCWTQFLNWYFGTIVFITKDLIEFLFCRM